MKKLLLALAFSSILLGQNTPATGLQPVSSPTPGGACTNSQPAFYSTADQNLYTCCAGVWTAVSGGDSPSVGTTIQQGNGTGGFSATGIAASAVVTNNGTNSITGTVSPSGGGVVNSNQVNGAAVSINNPCVGSDSSGHIVGGTCGGSPGANGVTYVGVSGTQNASNTAFTLASSQAAIQLFKNGQLLQPSVDYVLSGTSITTTVPPQSTDVLLTVVANTGSTVSSSLTVPGTTTSGYVVTWNSNTGASLGVGLPYSASNANSSLVETDPSLGLVPRDMIGCPTTTVSSTYTILNTDCMVVVTSASTITMPASPTAGKTVKVIAKSASNNVTLTAGGTINFQGCNTTQTTSMNLPATYFVDLTWDGTEWRVGIGPQGCLYTSSLTVNGAATAGNFSANNLFGVGSATIAVNATGAGTGGTAACETSSAYLCNGVSGTVKIVTAGVPVTGTVATITFPAASLSSKVRTCNVFSPGNGTFASVLAGGTLTWSESNSALTITSVTTPLTTGLTGDIKYQCF